MIVFILVKIHMEMIDFESAQEGYTPLSLRDVKLQKSDVEWADIGGRLSTYLNDYYHSKLYRPTSHTPDTSRDPGMANQICRNICQMPSEIAFWVSPRVILLSLL